MKQTVPTFVGIVTKSETSDNFVKDVRMLLKKHPFHLVRRGMNSNRVQFLKAGKSRRYTVGQSITVEQATYFRLYVNLKPRTIGYRCAEYPLALSAAKAVVRAVYDIYSSHGAKLSS